MRVACSRCNSQYEVPDDKLAAGAVRIRCSRCGQVFAVRRRAGEVPRREAEPLHKEAPPQEFDSGNFAAPKAEGRKTFP